MSQFSKLSSPVSLPEQQPLIHLTRPKPTLWIIELHNGPDARLTESLIDGGMKPALDVVEREWRDQRINDSNKGDTTAGTGALIIVGRQDQDKFFSNGLDFEKSILNPNFFPQTFNPMLERLLTFPIPTIAAINGHCFAGGMMLSLACDYRVMTDASKRNAWMCMNEVDFGAPWPTSFAAILRAKVPTAALHRKIALEGHRFSPAEALSVGLLDYTVPGKTTDILKKAEEIADRVGGKASAGVWGVIKMDLYRDALKGVRAQYRMRNAETEELALRSRL